MLNFNVTKEAFSFIHRRFVRIKALQNFYAYYIRQRACSEKSIDDISKNFKYDVFSKKPISKAQLAEGKEMAISLFNRVLHNKDLFFTTQVEIHEHIRQIVVSSIFHFNQEMKEHTMLLQQGFCDTEEQIYRAYLNILQLLIEWDYLATQDQYVNNQQANKMTTLHRNQILQNLESNASLIKLTKGKNISSGWENHKDLIISWYTNFVKKDIYTKQHRGQYPTSITEAEDQKFLEHLIKKIIFVNEEIQDFFTQQDLYWEENKVIVKKLLQAFLSLNNMQNQCNYLIPDSFTMNLKRAQKFYSDLIKISLVEQERQEQLISQKIEKWDINRLVLLDKIIIHLALTEIIHFDEIPIKVSINEYIDIAKQYSTPQSGQFVNGIIHAITEELNSNGLLRTNKKLTFSKRSK